MELQFLGTGAGMPSRHRNVASISLSLSEHHRGSWLFDCGEGTQRQMLRTTIKPGKIEKIFISHLHGDHIFGLPGLLTSRSMNGSSDPLTLYGPEGIKAFVETTLRLSGSWLGFPLDIVEISAGEVFNDAQFRVTAWPLTHPVECYGYRIEEHDRPGSLEAEKLKADGFPPGSYYYDLKQGRSVTLDDGRVVNGMDYVSSVIQGRSLAIFGDTGPTPAATELAANVDLLVHEATLQAAMGEKANGRGHSTTVQAAAVAQASGAKRLIVTHLSSRYLRHDCDRLLDECRAVFPATEMAHDFSVFTV